MRHPRKPPPNDAQTLTIFSAGHSNHPPDRFLELLRKHAIRAIADVRAFPGSRKWPHFAREALAASLADGGIDYRWMPQLGGRRPKSKPDSIHTAWTVEAFRAYSDYADTPEFEAALDELIEFGRKQATAFMCAEGLWWQCHRRIISDHLLVRGLEVVHIMPDGKLVEHQLPDFATIVSGKIAYNGEKTA